MKFTNFFDAYHFLYDHKIFLDKHKFSRFQECLDVQVVRVNPENEMIDDNPVLNTATRVWLECGPVDEETDATNIHDTDLDVGAYSFEQAIILLAEQVFQKYGDGKWEYTEEENQRFEAARHALFASRPLTETVELEVSDEAGPTSVEVDGYVGTNDNTNLTADEFLDAFIPWVEEKGWSFGGMAATRAYDYDPEEE